MLQCQNLKNFECLPANRNSTVADHDGTDSDACTRRTGPQTGGVDRAGSDTTGDCRVRPVQPAQRSRSPRDSRGISFSFFPFLCTAWPLLLLHHQQRSTLALCPSK